jgi:hypothetical protein
LVLQELVTMIVIAAFVLGALLGAYRARKRKGKLADILHYATIHAIAFALVGLMATLMIDRLID